MQPGARGLHTPRPPPRIEEVPIDELTSERAYVDIAFARLAELRAKAKQLAGEAYWRDEDYVVDSLFERDVVASQAAQRLATLDVPKGRLIVGRLDRDDGDRWYVGRVAVADPSGDPLVMDWRAPAAAAFYRAVAGDRLGVVRRRHFRWRWDELVGLDDEVFDTDAARRDGLDLVGEGALLAAISAPRTGRMTDVVATIQAEQDRVIRRPKPGVLVVQGAPGTGKTAVALHRAAYLLYGEHNTFRDAAILFVGPNETFLRYVEEVVPSLGEDRVVLVTPADLGPAVPVGREESDDIVRIKGDAKMAAVVGKAITNRERAPKEPQSISCGRFTLTLTPDVLAAVAARTRRATGTHNARRRLAERGVVAALEQAAVDARGREARHGFTGALTDEKPVLDLLDHRQVATIVDRVWPQLTPELLLRSLYRSTARMTRAGLSDEEATRLHRDDDDERWSEADVALLDEAAWLLGPLPQRRRRQKRRAMDPIVERVLADLTPDCPECGAELTFISRGGAPEDDRLRCDVCEPTRFFRAYEVMGDLAAQHLRSVHDSLVQRNVEPVAADRRPGDTTYGHVVVDEAQDLTAMQWRALARRCPTRSMTVAGDQGQAIRPGGTGTWEAAAAALGTDTFDLAELTVNYRTPVEVMHAAERWLAEAGIAFSPTRSVRSTCEPTEHVVERIDADAVGRVVDALEVDGTVAVIAPRARCDDLATVDAQVLDVTIAKGLEFDAVVVVDPNGIAAEGEGGARRVYVALTRTTTILHVIREA